MSLRDKSKKGAEETVGQSRKWRKRGREGRELLHERSGRLKKTGWVNRKAGRGFKERGVSSRPGKGIPRRMGGKKEKYREKNMG